MQYKNQEPNTTQLGRPSCDVLGSWFLHIACSANYFEGLFKWTSSDLAYPGGTTIQLRKGNVCRLQMSTVFVNDVGFEN